MLLMEIKKSLSEEDIKNRYITPAIEKSGWEKSFYRMEYYFTAGRVLIQGKQHARKEGKKADYILFVYNINAYAVSGNTCSEFSCS